MTSVCGTEKPAPMTKLPRFRSGRQPPEAGNRPFGPTLRPRLPVAAHPVLEGAELFQPDRSTSMEAAGRDPDFGAEAEFAAVGELGRSVVQDDRGVDLPKEFIGGGLIFGDDAIGVMRA